MPEPVREKKNTGRIVRNVILFVLVSLMAVAGTLLFLFHNPAASTAKTIFNISLDALCLWVVLVLIFATSHDPDSKSNHRSTLFVLLIFLHAIVLMADELAWLFHGYRDFREFSLIARVVFCTTSTLITYAFWHYAQESMRIRYKVLDIFITILTIGSILMCLSNLKYSTFFFIDTSGIFRVINQMLVPYVGYHAIVFFLISVLILFRKGVSRREQLTLLSFPVVIGIGFFASITDKEISITYIFSLMSMILLYSVFSVKRGKDLARRDTYLANQKVEAMVSQIQPDFMESVLDRIAGLCHEDSAKAEKAVSTFATFLRTNIDTLGSTSLIPFSREVAHVKNFMDLEQLTRSGSVEVIYEINCPDFDVPHLTLLPLVENAIMHGHVKGKPLHILVKAKQTQDGYSINVRDDGCGFDTAATLDQAKSNQTSLYGVKTRIETMCNGTFTIESHEGSGTLIIIDIPETEAKNS